MLPRLTFIRVFPVNLLMGYLLAGYLLVGKALVAVNQFSFADEVYIRDILYVHVKNVAYVNLVSKRELVDSH